MVKIYFSSESDKVSVSAPIYEWIKLYGINVLKQMCLGAGSLPVSVYPWLVISFDFV
ncbi:hypothetical protein ACT29H_03310 [Thermophagus sp. OGC60D27]|uniref:hypothetical protein n=1 Tax=Thermophagus sp. OGC60D27 TaxID=3458415 RepID=UPI004037970A